MTARVRTTAGRDYTGRTVGSIIRREWGRRASLYPSADPHAHVVGSVVGPHGYGGWPVLAVIAHTEGDWGDVRMVGDEADEPLPKSPPMSGEALRARREALGLTQKQLAALTGWPQPRFAEAESPRIRRRVPGRVADALDALEAKVSGLVEATVADAEAADGPVVLQIWADDATLWAAHPETTGLPASVHRVAMARARTTLVGRGRTVVIRPAG